MAMKYKMFLIILMSLLRQTNMIFNNFEKVNIAKKLYFLR